MPISGETEARRREAARERGADAARVCSSHPGFAAAARRAENCRKAGATKAGNWRTLHHGC